MTGVADGSAAGGWMLMDDLGAEGRVYGAGNSQTMRGEEDRQLAVRQSQLRQGTRERLTHAPTVLHAESEGFIHSATGFLGHAEGAVDQSARDVFRSGAEARDLVVVDGGRPVHCQVGDDATVHQLDQERGETRFDD